jgi:hypothetical protein
MKNCPSLVIKDLSVRLRKEGRYVVSLHWPVYRKRLHEFIHGPLQLGRVVRYSSLKVQCVEGHAEFLTETPEARETNGAGIEVVLPVVVLNHNNQVILNQ